jgi:hypothetical protein
MPLTPSGRGVPIRVRFDDAWTGAFVVLGLLLGIGVGSILGPHTRPVAMVLAVIAPIAMVAYALVREGAPTNPDPLVAVGRVTLSRSGWSVRWGSGRPRFKPRNHPPGDLVSSRWFYLSRADVKRLEATRFVLDRVEARGLHQGERIEPWDDLVEDVWGVPVPRAEGEFVGVGSPLVAVLTTHEMWLIVGGEHTWRAALDVDEASAVPSHCDARTLLRTLKWAAPDELVARVRRCVPSGGAFAVPRARVRSKIEREGNTWSLDLDGVAAPPGIARLVLHLTWDDRLVLTRWLAGGSRS